MTTTQVGGGLGATIVKKNNHKVRKEIMPQSAQRVRVK